MLEGGAENLKNRNDRRTSLASDLLAPHAQCKSFSEHRPYSMPRQQEVACFPCTSFKTLLHRRTRCMVFRLVSRPRPSILRSENGSLMYFCERTTHLVTICEMFCMGHRPLNADIINIPVDVYDWKLFYDMFMDKLYIRAQI